MADALAASRWATVESSSVSTALLADGRRQLRFNNLEEILADAETLATGSPRTLGKWTFAQILEHISQAMTCSLDGFDMQAPWFARVFIAPLVKNSFLTKTMKPGFRLPESAQRLLPASDVSLDAALENLRQVIARYQTEQATQPHPFLGRLTPQENILLHLRHSELHLSFVVPAT